MLNYIWLALIVVGILAAAGRDVFDIAENRFGNGIPWEIQEDELANTGDRGRFHSTLKFSPAQLARHYDGVEWKDTVVFRAQITKHEPGSGSVLLEVEEGHPEIFSLILQTQGGDMLHGSLSRPEQGEVWLLQLDPVKFIYLKNVTSAAFDAAGLAVRIALGLIGIMALWLGIMKIAEAAGLVGNIAALVRPLTVRLFPDVPPDHPAVTAMLMNISANMLGLGNAATPFGLKAMEELNKLNPRTGTATNAMVTFLALNTSCVTLVPATAIAVRAAAGSANPAIIIGTTFLASLTATVFAVTIAKILQRLPVFRYKPVEEK